MRTCSGLILPIIISFILCACKKESITYSTYTSDDKSYIVEVPSCMRKGESAAHLMSFVDRDAHSFIHIQRIDEENIDEYVATCSIKNNTFNYSLFQSSDTTAFYRITRGLNLWSAYDLYMLKRIGEEHYIIKVSSSTLDQADIIEIITHIYSSLQIAKNEEALNNGVLDKGKDRVQNKKTYSTQYYSINYPSDWVILKNIDEITEVYIGSTTDNIGFGIVRFETDLAFSEIIREITTNKQESGCKIITHKYQTIDGNKWYLEIYNQTLLGQERKYISYTTKHKGMVYNVTFIMSSNINYKEQSAHIMNSLQIR